MKKILIFVLLTLLCSFFSREAPGERMEYTDSRSPVLGAIYEGTAEGGTAVSGVAPHDSGTTYGVHGLSRSASGRGVYGYASSSTGIAYGVYGGSASNSGRGVYGYAFSLSGLTYGVLGESESNEGRGVYGYASAANGTTCGVRGVSASISGKGVYGTASSGTGTTYGVYGKVNSPNGYAVYSEGRMKVAGDLIAANVIPYEGYRNLARDATTSIEIVRFRQEGGSVTEETAPADMAEYSASYAMGNLRDDVYNQWDVGEWASRGVRPRADNPSTWIGVKYRFAGARSVDIVVIYPRPNPIDQILDAWLEIKRGETIVGNMHLGAFPYGGVPKEIPVRIGGVTEMTLKLTNATDGILNAGLAEWQVMGVES